MRTVFGGRFAVMIVLLSAFANAKLFSPRVSWLKPSAVSVEHDEKGTKVNNCFSLRGGANEKETEAKIKGLCIGIDLGTTYR